MRWFLVFILIFTLQEAEAASRKKRSVKRKTQWIQSTEGNWVDLSLEPSKKIEQDGEVRTPASATKPTPGLPPLPPKPKAANLVPIPKVASQSATGREKTIDYDENAPKGQKPVASENQGGKDHKNPPPPGTAKKGNIQSFGRWWPMCLFFESGVGNANQITKEMVDMAAKCEVNLVVFPFYIKSVGGKSASAITQEAKRKCNAVEGFGKFGANRASALTFTRNPMAARELCDARGASDVTGCAEQGFDRGPSQKFRLANVGYYGGVAGAGKVAAGILGPGSWNSRDAAAFGQGMAQMALTNGYNGGNGVGTWDEGYAAGGSADKTGWSDKGCEEMRKASFEDKAKRWKYNSEQETYVVLPKNSSKLLDLGDEKPLFTTPKGAPLGGQPKQVAQGGEGSGSGSSSVNPSSESGVSPVSSNPLAGHKFPKLKPPDSNVESKREGAGTSLRSSNSKNNPYASNMAAGVESPENAATGAGVEEGKTQDNPVSSSPNIAVTATTTRKPASSDRIALDESTKKGEKSVADLKSTVGPIQAGGDGVLKVNSSLQDDFFNRVQKTVDAREKDQSQRGQSLRKAGSIRSVTAGTVNPTPTTE